jgi:transcription termination factor Rho
LYPPKRFLGAARNIENGGSLTIIASAMVETGSIGDTVLFEEYKSTGNAELRLDRKIAEKRVFPAIDLASSSTRREELLMPEDEAAVLMTLRQALNLDPQRGIEQLLDQLRRTGSNAEFLLRLSRSADAALPVAHH